MQQESTLYAFLKKNAAYSSGTPSSKRASDFKSNTVEADKNYSTFNAGHQGQHQKNSAQQYQSAFNGSNNTYGNTGNYTNMLRGNNREDILV